MRHTFAALLLAGLLISMPEARASSPHYINGIMGLKAAMLPAPGNYFSQFFINYYANQVRNQNGDKISKELRAPFNKLDFKTDAFIAVANYTYSSKFEIFGGRWITDINIPVIYLDMAVSDLQGIPLPNHPSRSGSINTHSSGLSDIYVDPVVLSWSTDRYDLYLGGGVFMPTGRYDKNDPTSPGKGFWTVKPGAGAVIYFDKARTWSAAILAHYEFHTKQRQTDITPGQHFHFEWGIGKTFAKYWQAGPVGYASWQVTKDKGPSASTNKSRVFAAGFEIDRAITAWKGGQIGIRSNWEFGARSNTQGNTTTLTLTLAF